jgi:hypothetical protein
MEEQSATDALIEALVKKGCDIPSAMARFLNDKGFYCQILRTVPEETAFADLGKALQEGDRKTGFEKAHELKGMLANMGLTPMYQEACAIVEPLRAGKLTGTLEHYETLMKQLDDLKDLLSHC